MLETVLTMDRKCYSIEYIPRFFLFVVVCLFAFMSIELISNDVICKFYTQQVGNIYIATGMIKILMEKIRIICFEEWLRCDCFQAFREANVKVVEKVQI